jgi:hypothetical protein
LATFDPFAGTATSRRLLQNTQAPQAKSECSKTIEVTDEATLASFNAAESTLWQAFCEFWIDSGADRPGIEDDLLAYLSQAPESYSWLKQLATDAEFREVC